MRNFLLTHIGNIITFTLLPLIVIYSVTKDVRDKIFFTFTKDQSNVLVNVLHHL